MREPNFGWSLPAGVSQAMIDRSFGEEAPCDVCGQWEDECVCPECPVCGEYGNPKCYHGTTGHGLVRSFGQVALRAEADAAIAAAAAEENAMIGRWIKQRRCLQMAIDQARKTRDESGYREVAMTKEDIAIFLNLRLLKPQWGSPLGSYGHVCAYSQTLNT